MQLIKQIEALEIDGPALEDGEVIVDVVILCRLMKADERHSALAVYASEHTDALLQFGLVQSAVTVLADSMTANERDK